MKATYYTNNVNIRRWPLHCILYGIFLVVMKAPAEIPSTEQLKA